MLKRLIVMAVLMVASLEAMENGKDCFVPLSKKMSDSSLELPVGSPEGKRQSPFSRGDNLMIQFKEIRTKLLSLIQEEGMITADVEDLKKMVEKMVVLSQEIKVERARQQTGPGAGCWSSEFLEQVESFRNWFNNSPLGQLRVVYFP